LSAGRVDAGFRLLDTGAADGAWNMALDDAILEAVRAGDAPATLRFYRWNQPTLSLGYAQSLAGLDLDALAAEGCALVRRPTGGRAVLHPGGDAELTYALAATGLPDGVSASYRVIADALVAGLAAFGLAAAVAPAATRPGRSPACFASGTRADLVVGARKVVGSAQVRRAGAVLQHGTIYLKRPAGLAARLLPDERDVADLASLAGREPGWAEVRDALAAGVLAAFATSGAWGELLASERAHAARRRDDFAVTSISI